MDVLARFLQYIAFPTTSKEDSDTFPSTKAQLDFGRKIVQELQALGLTDVTQDEKGYVFATVPATVSGQPVIGLIAHMDTSPDANGEDITPVITRHYDGGVIRRSFGELSPAEFPELRNYIGQDILCSNGATLLGADDKAGMAEIITAAQYLLEHPEVPHGEIRLGFTPDEEVGRGADYFDVKRFGADFAYTLDGGAIGELEYENFNAARADLVIHGKSVHPGTAKGVMINAGLLGAIFAGKLPLDETPATTEGYEGFFHLTHLTGDVNECRLSYIIRDFDREAFEARKQLLTGAVEELNAQYGQVCEIHITDQYYNMKEKIAGREEMIERAKKAMERCGIKPKLSPIRGGTDGARLSFMGLVCPNLFAGGHNFHGPYEFIPVQSMQKAVEMIVALVQPMEGRD